MWSLQETSPLSVRFEGLTNEPEWAGGGLYSPSVAVVVQIGTDGT